MLWMGDSCSVTAYWGKRTDQRKNGALYLAFASLNVRKQIKKTHLNYPRITATSSVQIKTPLVSLLSWTQTEIYPPPHPKTAVAARFRHSEIFSSDYWEKKPEESKQGSRVNKRRLKEQRTSSLRNTSISVSHKLHKQRAQIHRWQWKHTPEEPRRICQAAYETLTSLTQGLYQTQLRNVVRLECL